MRSRRKRLNEAGLGDAGLHEVTRRIGLEQVLSKKKIKLEKMRLHWVILCWWWWVTRGDLVKCWTKWGYVKSRLCEGRSPKTGLNCILNWPFISSRTLYRGASLEPWRQRVWNTRLYPQLSSFRISASIVQVKERSEACGEIRKQMVIALEQWFTA